MRPLRPPGRHVPDAAQFSTHVAVPRPRHGKEVRHSVFFFFQVVFVGDERHATLRESPNATSFSAGPRPSQQRHPRRRVRREPASARRLPRLRQSPPRRPLLRGDESPVAALAPDALPPPRPSPPRLALPPLGAAGLPQQRRRRPPPFRDHARLLGPRSLAPRLHARQPPLHPRQLRRHHGPPLPPGPHHRRLSAIIGPRLVGER
mmetsp:Transcript_13696/g.41421  ORF Transcript_13696/g.41421 Transcript_13696/m.41421 type:complete len:205 (-) Transcript_13696:476-1090(-)